MNDYWVYILTNIPRRTVLYIGVTNSLEVRLAQHRRGEVRGFAWRTTLSRSFTMSNSRNR